MKSTSNQKLRLLCIIDIFLKKSDEEHVLSAQDIISCLEHDYNIACERKTVYDCVDTLNEFGFDIIKSNSPRGYFMASRVFEPSELRLLTDAIQSASFISINKTKTLLNKLSAFASEYQYKRIKNQVYVDNRNKSDNEKLFYNIDMLNFAILKRRQVEITYRRKKFSEGHINYDEKAMVINPYALIWSNDRYYLVGNYDKYDNLLHLRIDRIVNVNITDNLSRHFSEVSPYHTSFDTADYSKRHLSMFSGDIKPVSLICKNDIIDDFTDRFGEKCSLRQYDSESFCAEINVAVTEGLVSWIMQYGDKITVQSPKVLKNMIIERAESILSLYNQ